MTDIRRLLSGAADDQSLRPISTDPLPKLNKAARRRRAGAAFTSVTLAIGAAVLLLFILPGGGNSHIKTYVGTTPSPHPAARSTSSARSWSTGGPVYNLATGLGYAWLNRGSFAEQTTLTGTVDHTFSGQHMDHVTDITVAGAQVWLLGTSHGRADVRLTAYNPATRNETTIQLPHGAGTLFGTSAYWNGALWVAEPALNMVIGFSLVGSGEPIFSSDVSIADPQTLAVTGTGQLWVEHSHDARLTEIVPKPGVFHGQVIPSQTGTTVKWNQPIFAPAPGKALWSTDGSRLIGLTPSYLREGDSIAQGYRLQGNGRPNQVVDAAGGIFSDTGDTVDYWDSKDVRTGYTPTARRTPYHCPNGSDCPDISISEIAADGAGVLILESGRVTEWIPKPS